MKKMRLNTLYPLLALSTFAACINYGGRTKGKTPLEIIKDGGRTKGKTPLEIIKAICHDLLEKPDKALVENVFFQESNEDPEDDLKKTSPLIWAFKKEHIDIVKIILEALKRTNAKRSPNYLKTENGINFFNLPDGDGKTLLHWAAIRGEASIVELLYY